MTESFSYNSSTLQESEVTFTEFSELSQELKRLKASSDQDRQELYELRRKYELSVLMHTELAECNESLEKLLSELKERKAEEIHEIEEKFRDENEELKSHIEQLEKSLDVKKEEILKLKEINNEYKQKLETSIIVNPDLEDLTKPLECKIQKLEFLLEEKDSESKEIQIQMQHMQDQYSELKEILKVTKDQLTEKNEVLESTKEELFMCRSKLNALEAVPASESAKGNSLFAEVEDRRQKMIDKMKKLETGYIDVRRMLQSKDAEIKMLKNDRCALLEKLEVDTIETFEDNAKLIESFKEQIRELENKLKEERSKKSAIALSENSLSYVPSLLAKKTKEVEELELKIQKNAMCNLLMEEKMCNLSKELRTWKYKAMAAEAKLSSIEYQRQTTTGISSESLELHRTNEKSANKKSPKQNSLSLSDKQLPPVSSYDVKERVLVCQNVTANPLSNYERSSINTSLEKVANSEQQNAIKTNLDRGVSLNKRVAMKSIGISPTKGIETKTNFYNVTPDWEKNSTIILNESIEIEDTEKNILHETIRNEPEIKTDCLIGNETLLLDKSIEDETMPISSIFQQNLTNDKEDKENSLVKQFPTSILKSSTSKANKEEKTKKAMFTADTRDPLGTVLKKNKEFKRNYPMVIVSSDLKQQ